MVLHIRNAILEDLHQITTIEARCFPKAEAASKSIFRERMKVFSKGFFVAEIEGRIIGFINGGATDKEHIEDEFFSDMSHHNDKGPNLVIFGLDVLPEYQKKGYAQQLMEHFIKEAKNAGRKKILLTCKEHLISYYQRFGYINEGVSQSVHGGAKWFDMYLLI